MRNGHFLNGLHNCVKGVKFKIANSCEILFSMKHQKPIRKRIVCAKNAQKISPGVYKHLLWELVRGEGISARLNSATSHKQSTIASGPLMSMPLPSQQKTLLQQSEFVVRKFGQIIICTTF